MFGISHDHSGRGSFPNKSIMHHIAHMLLLNLLDLSIPPKWGVDKQKQESQKHDRQVIFLAFAMGSCMALLLGLDQVGRISCVPFFTMYTLHVANDEGKYIHKSTCVGSCSTHAFESTVRYMC